MPASTRITPGNRPWTGAGAGPTAGLNRYRHCVGNVSLSDPGLLDTQKRILFSVLSFCLSVCLCSHCVGNVSLSDSDSRTQKRIPFSVLSVCPSLQPLCGECQPQSSELPADTKRGFRFRFCLSVCLCSYCVENVSLSDSDSRTQKRIPFLVLSVSVATMWRMSVSVVWTPGHKREFRFRFFNLSVSLCSET